MTPVLSVEAIQERFICVCDATAAVSPVGVVGGVVSVGAGGGDGGGDGDAGGGDGAGGAGGGVAAKSVGVVADNAVDGGETLPAASYAATVNEYAVEGRRLIAAYFNPCAEPTMVPFR